VTPPRHRVWCWTVGCDKNLVDSEALLGRFTSQGCEVVPEPENANIWVLNTCGFIAAARADSLAALEELVTAKDERQTLVVLGCWAQEHGSFIQSRYPAVDLVAGVGQFDEVVAACLAGSPARIFISPHQARYPGLAERPLLTPPHLAFVKISEGCNCNCTFCRIPLIRGPLRSRPVREIVAEVESLAGRGVQEIQLVSQNSSDYGRDSGENLLSLVRALHEIDELRWIRILYLYPGLITAENLLDVVELDKVLPYLDLPIQHASPRLLQAMKRPGYPGAVEKFMMTLRRQRPKLVLRTTVLLGFPGEEDEDVEILADFLARVEFDHLGAYRYSPEEGTPAATLANRVPDELVADREALILDLQGEISLRRQQARLGEIHRVIVDRVIAAGEERELLDALGDGIWWKKSERNDWPMVMTKDAQVAIGRSYHFGYDLDGVVALSAGELQPGDWVRTRFIGVTPFDIWAMAV